MEAEGERIPARYPACVTSCRPDADKLSSSRQSIELMVGQGRLLQLDEAAESVYVGDTTIADLRVVAPDVVYIYGRKIGSTNLIAISAEHKMRANVAFRVVADAGSANSAIRDLQPTTHTKLRLFGNRVAATGRTNSVEEAVDAQNTRTLSLRRNSRRSTTPQSTARNRSISGCVLPRCRAMTSSAWASGRQVAVALRLAAAAVRWMPSSERCNATG